MTLTHFIRTSASALSALAIAFVMPASAADLYGSGGGLKDIPVVPQLPNWSGFYIGGHMGAAWANLDLNRQDFHNLVGPDPVNDPVFGGGSLNSNGAFGGAQLGFNWQNGNCCFVYGVEMDIGGLAGDNEHSFLVATPNETGAVTFKHDGGFYGDITGRLGYAWNNSALIYAKGGFAWLNSDFQTHETVFDAGLPGGRVDFNQDRNDTLTGWTVGGGIEWMVGPNWSIKAEYMHFDFSGDDNHCCSDGFNDFRNNADLTVDTVKLGFNYLFHSAAEPLPYK